jgi:hypothetical protein
MSDEPNSLQRIALVAVLNGAVRLDRNGCRIYPEGVSAQALDAAKRRGWWEWESFEPGTVASLTESGVRALR